MPHVYMRAERGVLECFQYNSGNVQAMMYQLDLPPPPLIL